MSLALADEPLPLATDADGVVWGVRDASHARCGRNEVVLA
jgi:hypothetical protein